MEMAEGGSVDRHLTLPTHHFLTPHLHLTTYVPRGVAHHTSVSQHPLVRLDAKLPQQSLVLIFN